MIRMKATWYVIGLVTGFLLFIAASEAEAECPEDPPTYTYVHGAIEYRANGNVWLRVIPYYSCSAFTEIGEGDCGCILGGQNAFYCPSEIPQTVGLRGGDTIYITLTVHGPASGLTFEPGDAVEMTQNSPGPYQMQSGIYCQNYRWHFQMYDSGASDELEKAFDEAFELQEERVVYLGKVNGVGWCFTSVSAICLSEYRLAPLSPVQAITFGGLYLEGNVAVEMYPEYRVLTGNPGGCNPECYELDRKPQVRRTWGAIKRTYSN